jgi:hypothetical protein
LVQRETRDLFREKFGVSKDEEFAFYEPPLEDEVELFDRMDESATGPDPSNLKFDFDKDVSSRWNQSVILQLVEELERNSREDRLPDVPKFYLEHLVIEKFKRCKGFWNQAKRRAIGSEIETWDEVEMRMKGTMTKHGEAARRRERRVKVCQSTRNYGGMGIDAIGCRNIQGGCKLFGWSFVRRMKQLPMTLSSGDGYVE